jgi:hypothetical protein
MKSDGWLVPIDDLDTRATVRPAAWASRKGDDSALQSGADSASLEMLSAECVCVTTVET